MQRLDMPGAKGLGAPANTSATGLATAQGRFQLEEKRSLPVIHICIASSGLLFRNSLKGSFKKDIDIDVEELNLSYQNLDI